MQVGEFALELDQRVIGAGDVAGAAGAGAHAGGGFHHGADHLGVLRHAEVIVGAPDHHLARAIRGMPAGMRKAPGDALKVGEDAVAAFLAQFAQGGGKIGLVIHAIYFPAPHA